MTLREFTEACLIAARDTGCRQPTANEIAADWLAFDDLDDEAWMLNARASLIPTIQHHINYMTKGIHGNAS